jgi:hypothetical protein
VARRSSKYTKAIPNLTDDPIDNPVVDSLKLEIAIRKGTLGKCLPAEVRGDLTELLNVDISNASWYVSVLSQFEYR